MSGDVTSTTFTSVKVKCLVSVLLCSIEINLPPEICSSWMQSRWLERSTVAIRSNVNAWDVPCCSKPVATWSFLWSVKWIVGQCGRAVSVVSYQKVVAIRSTFINNVPTLAFIQSSRVANQDGICVVTEVSIFLIITQVSRGLIKNSHL